MNNLFLNVLTISVLSSFLILTVIIIRSLFKKLSKNYICLLWGLTALRLMTTFSFKTEFGIVSNTAYIRRDIYNAVVYPSIIYADNGIDTVSILSFIWITGVIIFISYFIYSYFSLKRNLEHSYKLKDNICLTDRYNSPFVFGVIKPEIYIPLSTNDKDIDKDQIFLLAATIQKIMKTKNHIRKPDTIFYENNILNKHQKVM